MANYIFSDIPAPSSTSLDTIRLGASSGKYVTDILHVAWTDDESDSTKPESISNTNDFLRLLKYGIEQMSEIIDDQTAHYNFLDILWSDGTATQGVRPTTDGVTPIGLCVAPTGFFGPNEGARFMALKYAGGTSDGTPTYSPSGSTTWENQKLQWTLESAYTDVPELTNYGKLTLSTDAPVKLADYQGGNNGCDAVEHIMLYTENGTWIGLEQDNELNGFALGDINGKQNTITVYNLNSSNIDIYPAFSSISYYFTDGTQAGDWYLPALGELAIVCANQSRINPVLSDISNKYGSDCMSSIHSGIYWSSTENDDEYTFCIDFVDGIEQKEKKSPNLAIPMLIKGNTVSPTPTPTPTPIPLTD